ncbi:hypothetical protein AB5J49_25510 [Streptomyces sp. R28]|uniref:Uncharacterized protein n=1 Tax=Streptomyces sp. R28 TaxID=3238628 RepID=A0AB39Q482_9ACTN
MEPGPGGSVTQSAHIGDTILAAHSSFSSTCATTSTGVLVRAGQSEKAALIYRNSEDDRRQGVAAEPDDPPDRSG